MVLIKDDMAKQAKHFHHNYMRVCRSEGAAARVWRICTHYSPKAQWQRT